MRAAPDQLAVRDGALAIDTGNNTDMFGGNTTAENIVLQPAPEEGWEITTEVTLPFTGKDYEQAGLMVHGGDADWAKLMFIKVPENDGRQVEFTLQDNGSASFDPALDRSAFLPESFPDTIHLRIRSDGTSLTAAYSEDGTEWTDVGRVRPAGAIPDPRIGVAAFNGDGSGNEAEFDFFHVDPLDVEPTCTEPEAPDPGYEMLFDGTAESASQWQMAGPGGFNLTAQCTLESFGGLGMLYRDELYEGPVSFRLDWMIPGDDNSGVVVGNWEPDPDYPSGPAWDALDNGYEIQIDATDDLDSTTGALYNIQAPDQELRDEALNPPGEWNTFEITVDDPEIIVRLNGVVINEYVHDPGTYPNRDISATKLGIQNHGPGDTIFYRRIQVMELTGRSTSRPVIDLDRRRPRRVPGSTRRCRSLSGTPRSPSTSPSPRSELVPTSAPRAPSASPPDTPRTHGQPRPRSSRLPRRLRRSAELRVGLSATAGSLEPSRSTTPEPQDVWVYPTDTPTPDDPGDLLRRLPSRRRELRPPEVSDPSVTVTAIRLSRSAPSRTRPSGRATLTLDPEPDPGQPDLRLSVPRNPRGQARKAALPPRPQHGRRRLRVRSAFA